MINSKQRLKIVLIFAGFCGCYGAVIYKLYRMQIVQHVFYKNLAKKQSQISITQNPPRAFIFDRNGVAIASNREALSAFIIPKKIQNKEVVAQFLEKNFPKSYQQFQSKKDATFLYIARRLTKEQEQLLRESGLKDIKFLHEPSRYYPYSSCASIVGLTDIDNHGITGIEYTYHKQLAGLPATCIIQKDARSGTFYTQKDVSTARGRNAQVEWS
jgi:stage V sporulation protein D (sporulation-specific penicillin-binding protein)